MRIDLIGIVHFILRGRGRGARGGIADEIIKQENKGLYHNIKIMIIFLTFFFCASHSLPMINFLMTFFFLNWLLHNQTSLVLGKKKITRDTKNSSPGKE